MNKRKIVFESLVQAFKFTSLVYGLIFGCFLITYWISITDLAVLMLVGQIIFVFVCAFVFNYYSKKFG